MTDEQRLVLLKGCLKAIEASAYKDEAMLKRINGTLEGLRTLFENPPSKQGGVVVLEPAGERLDAAVRGMKFLIESFVEEMKARKEDAKHKEGVAVLKALLPEGLTPVIYIPIDAEIAAVKAFLLRSKEHEGFLKANQLDRFVPLIEECLQELEGLADSKLQPATGPSSKELQAARKTLSGVVVDLRRYSKSRFLKGDAAEQTFGNQILALIKRSEDAS